MPSGPNAPRRCLSILLTLWVCASGAAGAAPRVAYLYTGRPLTEALDDLRARGLRLIYSGDLVHPDMIVPAEPRSRSPRKALDQLLAPFGLRSQDGPEGTVLIVAAPRPA